MALTKARLLKHDFPVHGHLCSFARICVFLRLTAFRTPVFGSGILVKKLVALKIGDFVVVDFSSWGEFIPAFFQGNWL